MIIPRKRRSLSTIEKSLLLCARSHPEIHALYLFGSQAKGKSGPLSDLDIAVLLKIRQGQGTSKTAFWKRLELASDLMHACRRPDVDVVLLDEATPLLAYQVVRAGKLLYERDHFHRIEFEVGALKRFFDFRPFLEVARQILKRRLQEGRYGG